MEGFLIRGWKTILPVVRWPYVRSPANQRVRSSVCGVCFLECGMRLRKQHSGEGDGIIAATRTFA